MKRAYMKPSMEKIELQYVTQLLQSSITNLQSNGWNDAEDELDLSDQGGGSSIWAR